MMSETRFEMYVGTTEERTAALEIMKKALIEKGYEDFANDLSMERGDDYMITNSLYSNLTSENFYEAIKVVYTAMITEMPEADFMGSASIAEGTYEGTSSFDKRGNLFKTEEFEGFDHGVCPECGDTVVYSSEYDPEKTYICPECGEECDPEEMFWGAVPRIEKATYEIINGELVEK